MRVMSSYECATTFEHVKLYSGYLTQGYSATDCVSHDAMAGEEGIFDGSLPPSFSYSRRIL